MATLNVQASNGILSWPQVHAERGQGMDQNSRVERDPSGSSSRRMSDDDVAWAVELMARRRTRYADYSPVFWRPHRDAIASHVPFLRAQVNSRECIAIRTEQGFLIGRATGDMLLIDDFAVVGDDAWAVDGQELVLTAWERRPARTFSVRDVTAAADTPKVSMLNHLQLAVVEQWWVKSLHDVRPQEHDRPQAMTTETWSGLLASAPPVYDPGGPVLLIREMSPAADLRSVQRAAENAGAALIVFPIPFGNDREHDAAQSGWSVASQWFVGAPRNTTGGPT